MDNNDWYEENDHEWKIKKDTIEELIEVAQRQIFGETQTENLVTFLICTAFEYRFDPEYARAFYLAAMIISRLPE